MESAVPWRFARLFLAGLLMLSMVAWAQGSVPAARLASEPASPSLDRRAGPPAPTDPAPRRGQGRCDEGDECPHCYC